MEHINDSWNQANSSSSMQLALPEGSDAIIARTTFVIDRGNLFTFHFNFNGHCQNSGLEWRYQVIDIVWEVSEDINDTLIKNKSLLSVIAVIAVR